MHVPARQLYVRDQGERRSLPYVRAHRHRIPESSVKRIADRQIHTRLATDSNTQNGLVVPTINLAISCKGQWRIAN